MNDELEWVVTNARAGRGPCESCPVQSTENCQHITPGYGSVDAEIMFVREEPSAGMNWGVQPPWNSSGKIVSNSHEWKEIYDELDERFLSPLALRRDDIWVTASIKCPPRVTDQTDQQFNAEHAFGPCSEYLRREIRQIDPAVIIALGDTAAVRTFQTLGVDASQTGPITIKRHGGTSPFETNPPVLVSPAADAYPSSDQIYQQVRTAITDYREP